MAWCQEEEKRQAYLRQEDSHISAVSLQNEIGVNVMSHSYLMYVAVVSLQKNIGVNEVSFQNEIGVNVVSHS